MMPLLSPADRLIVALDFPAAQPALELVDRLQGTCTWFKIGIELYYSAGNKLVEHLAGRGFNIFLDLKLHDIPNTVASAVRSVSNLGAQLLTVHASGGEAMMRAAAEAAARPGAPRLLAVTVLTSMDATQLRATGISDTPAQQVIRLASLAKSCTINGIVCSPEEIVELRRTLGSDVVLVTPGVRPAGADPGDQRRIATPGDTLARGASMLVIGRPITQAKAPEQAARAILQEMAAAAAERLES